MKGVGLTILPSFFYDLNAVTDERRARWVDEFAVPSQDSGIINPVADWGKFERNMFYRRWIESFKHKGIPYLRPGQFKWQAIRVLHDAHSETTRKDWWPNYRDCLFRVWLNPQTVYDEVTGEHKQWYLLCPEDGYLVNRQELLKAGTIPEMRNYEGVEKYLSSDIRLRRARLIPVECCHHLTNEGLEFKADL